MKGTRTANIIPSEDANPKGVVMDDNLSVSRLPFRLCRREAEASRSAVLFDDVDLAVHNAALQSGDHSTPGCGRSR